MEFTPIRPIDPLWAAPVEEKEAEAAPAGSVFADIFRKAIQDVRDTNQEQVNLEYQLSTGQLDNPATLSMALYKAEVATQLFVQVREKALNAYNELSRISL